MSELMQCDDGLDRARKTLAMKAGRRVVQVMCDLAADLKEQQLEPGESRGRLEDAAADIIHGLLCKIERGLVRSEL